MIACAQELLKVAEPTPKRRRAALHLPPVAGYRKSVLFGRWILWALILGVISLILYTATDNADNDKARVVFSQIKEVGDIQNIMNNPYYHGLDKNNLPYTVIAQRAIQKDADTVLLEGIKADMETESGKWIALHANHGEIKVEKRFLTLTKDVDMFYDGGYEFRSDLAYVDIDKGSAYGDLPVAGQGPMGTLNANSFSVAERGKVIYFKGAVKVVLYRE